MSQKELDFETLVLIAGGHTAFQLLWAGIELGLYDQLSAKPGMSKGDIEAALGLNPQPTRILLVGLTALGLIKKNNGEYSNADLTEQALVSGKPSSAAPILGWQRYIVYPGLTDFVSSLKADSNTGLQVFPGPGNTLYERLTQHPREEKVFQDAMSALSSQANAHLVNGVDFSRYSHLLDVGGGDGSNGLALAEAFPHLKVTVFDSASVCEIAEKNIASRGMGDRVSTYPGEMFTTPFPPGVDAILFSHIFTIWSLDRDRELLSKAFDSLSEGGSVLVFGMMADDDDEGPLSTALGSPYFQAIATGEGMLYSWADYEQQMKSIGFSRVERIEDMPLSHGVLIGTK